MSTPDDNMRGVTLSRYEVTGTLRESQRTRVCKALRLANREPVILKILKPDAATKQDLAHFRREYGILSKATSAVTPRVLGIEEFGSSLVMVLQDIGGTSLDHLSPNTALPVREFLSLTIGLAATLDELHHQRITHKAICPDHIIFNRDTGQFRLVGFGSADELPELNVTFQPQALSGRELAYISPEQTGRMNRAVDYRTDFYSLGATFYRLLTGRVPFEAQDSLGWVHCHIAANPIPPHEVDASIPETLSRIVLKLMAKMAEDRYQSASALRADLERCRQELSERGTISDFELGRHDFTDRLHAPQKLYGREQELMQLFQAFDRVRTGGRELMLVGGYSGVGKTTLIQEIQRPVVEAHGYLLKIKFDQLQRNMPLHAWTRAFRGLVNSLLMESETQLAHLRERILQGVGNLGRALTELIPSLELIIGPQPELPALHAAEAGNRLRYVFVEFIRAVATSEHPLVIVADDLHWVNEDSLAPLETLLRSNLISYVLVIGAYRENEVDALHPLELTTERLRTRKVRIGRLLLQDLTESTVNELMADVLHAPRERTISLTRLLYEKTGGNPLFLLQTLRALAQQKVITFDMEQRSWRWDTEAVRQWQITDNVVTLMLGKIRQLPKETQDILPFAACLGFSFRLADLAAIGKQSEERTLELLHPALREGMLTFSSDDFQFAHDRIQQAAYELIPEAERKYVHLAIGQMLRQQLQEDDSSNQLFAVVDHLNIGSEILTSREERRDLAQFNAKAGQKAKASDTFVTAHKYFETGLRLLAEERWVTDYDFSLELHSLATEAATLVGDFERSDRIFDSVARHARNALDMVAVYLAKIGARTAQGRPQEALDCALEFLDRVGIHVEPQPSAEDVERALADVMSCYDPRAIGALADLPEMTDPPKRAAMRILEAATPAAFMSRPYLYALFLFEQVRLSIQHGNAPESMFAYCNLAFRLCAIPEGNIDQGFAFSQLATVLAERSTVVALVPRLIATNVGMVWQFKRHIRETFEPLLPLYSRHKQVGDFEHAGYVLCFYARNAYLSGMPLAELDQVLIGCTEDLKSIRSDAVPPYFLAFRQAVQNLLGKSECPWVLDGAVYDRESMLRVISNRGIGLGQMALHSNSLVLCYLFGHYDDALAASAECEQCRPGLIADPTWFFYDSLTRLALFSDSSGANRAHLLERVAVNQDYLNTLSHYTPQNYLHKWHLVEAEKARVLGRALDAMEHFNNAISYAQKNGFIQEEALANERTARFWLEKDKSEFAKAHLRSAHEQYARWQGWAKVEALEAEFPHWLQSRNDVHPEQRAASLDLDTVTKATQAISGEMEMDRLLSLVMHTVIENAGAERGYLLIEEAGEWSVAAQGCIDQSAVALPLSAQVEEDEGLALGVVRFVARTLQRVVLEDAANNGDFINDPCIQKRQTKSLLCAPLLNLGRLTAILYLENNLTTHAFTPDRLRLLEMLLSQAATSIENARVFRKLKESEARYRRINRELHAISSCNQTLLRASDEQSLINEICRIVCDEAGYRMAWVGYAQDDDAKSVRPVAWAGVENGYLAAVDICWADDTVRGRGPAGTAIRSGRTSCSQDFANDANFAWREAALERGYRSAISLPLQDEHAKAFGVLTIYSSEPDAFSPEEIRMLEEMSGDLAYGIITMRTRATRQRAEQDVALLSFALDNVREAAFLIDENARFLYVNEEACRALGYTREELLGMTVLDVDPDFPAEHWPRQWASTKANHSVTLESRHRANDGRVYPVEISTNYFQYGGIEYNLALARDITERKQAEEEQARLRQHLHQSQKMEAIGQLAGGVAHDFNNILGIINGYTEILLSQRDLKQAHEAALEEILSAGLRAAALTRQLLAFSRKLLLQPKVLDLNSVIQAFEKMLRRLIGDEIEVRTILDSNLSAVSADPNQMEQVLLNFCINARDAMPEGGRITIETANLELDEGMTVQQLQQAAGSFSPVCGGELVPGRYVRLSVSDTGVGMDRETMSHIFEPFFTTKGPEHGTGLGLATVYGIVKQSGGHLSVYSEPGHGATFRVYLPAVKQETRESEQIATPHESLRGTETVLLVEDAAPLRTIYRKILEDKGYAVLEAGDGEHAIYVADQYEGNIALLLTDVSLPKMKGPAVAKILLHERPTMKVLFMSGHSDEVISGHNNLLPAGTSFIQKPFGAEELFRRLREMLNQH